ncbi:MAG: hypothetical protein KDA89_07240, partial [Planctomycetaceae bacterium]|nr:hypothetical protein [Planctomycetaceae bacterium]
FARQVLSRSGRLAEPWVATYSYLRGRLWEIAAGITIAHRHWRAPFRLTLTLLTGELLICDR